MVKIGKIKFSHVKNNRGVKTDYFRIVSDTKAKTGDWDQKSTFPETLNELEFYFPFSKMENNIKIGYSGYCKLPTAKNGKEDTYFVVSEGIGCPMIATPDGHNGKIYDGRGKHEILLTEERLKQWKMVKKRMTVFMTPLGCSPNEFITWNTTSEIAIGSFVQSYIDMVGLFKDNLSLIPLCFKAVGKSGKTSGGKPYRFFYGSLGAKRGLSGLMEGYQKALEYRSVFDVKSLEKSFEEEAYFYIDDDEQAIDDNQTTEKIDKETGEVVKINKETGEVVNSSSSISYVDILKSFVNDTQAKRILDLAKDQHKEEDILKVNSIPQALSLLNRLQSSKNAA